MPVEEDQGLKASVHYEIRRTVNGKYSLVRLGSFAPSRPMFCDLHKLMGYLQNSISKTLLKEALRTFHREGVVIVEADLERTQLPDGGQRSWRAVARELAKERDADRIRKLSLELNSLLPHKASLSPSRRPRKR